MIKKDVQLPRHNAVKPPPFMKPLLITALLLSLFALPAEAQESRSRRSTSQRLEQLQRDRRSGHSEREQGFERRESERYNSERYNSERRDFERRESSRNDGTPSRSYDPEDLEYRRDSGHSVRRGSTHDLGNRGGRSVFGLSNERGVIIFEPSRTLIIQQRDRNEGRGVIDLDRDRDLVPPSRLPDFVTPVPTVAVPQSQQQDPRRLHGETISPFTARVYAKSALAGYEGPSEVYSVITRFSPGQRVTALQSAGGADGFQWYLVASERQSAWVRGDRLLLVQ